MEKTRVASNFFMRHITSLGLFLILLLALPLCGLLGTGNSNFSHITLFANPIEPGVKSLDWLVWGFVAILILGTLSPFFWRFFNLSVVSTQQANRTAIFPWWGWIAIVWVIGSWILAWNRFSWFSALQPHTFPLLWLGYILLINALTHQRSGRCLLHQPWLLIQLFFLSSGFWWTFEYLNQYVHNWHYVNLPEMSPVEYFSSTSISFSTVLPAILSTYHCLDTFPQLTRPFATWHLLPGVTNFKTGWSLFALGTIGLTLIGIWPMYLFPLLWISPLSLLLGLQCIRNQDAGFRCVSQGDWRPMILSALAALVCGFWWELWNTYSWVHWEYTLPYVHSLKLFEMPALGYSGYLPFGLTCLAITELALGNQSHQSRTLRPPPHEGMRLSREASLV